MATLTYSQGINVSIRPMEEADLNEARRICRVAFGTFLGVPEPETFWADREYVFTRWRTDASAALVAEANGNLAKRGFRTDIQGVAMHRLDSPAYNRTDVFIVDDWR